MAGWFGLLGSGEFQDWSREVDAWLLDRATGDGRVLVLPTASAPEGDEVFSRWADAGHAHFSAVGTEVHVLEVRDVTDANDRAIADQVVGASAVYFSGGNPAYLARTLADSLLWQAVVTGLDRGMAYLGCSAGIAALGRRAPDSTVRSLSPDGWQPGLGLFPSTWLGPHWDALDRFAPGLVDAMARSVPAADTLVGVDEQTALVGEGQTWRVVGRGGVHVRDGDSWQTFVGGQDVELDLTGGPGR